MKTYVLTVSRNFPATHPRKGEETLFEYKILNALYPKQTYFALECKCGWMGMSHLADGGGQIADTGDYDDLYCPKCGSPNMDDTEMSITYYNQHKDVWPKIHTIRANYPLWKKRIDEVNAGKAVLSIRYWSGKPYNSKQVEIAKLTEAGIQMLEFTSLGFRSRPIINGYMEDGNYFSKLAKNDGLSLQDFEDWFKGYDLSQPMAIIHFTNFRY